MIVKLHNLNTWDLTQTCKKWFVSISHLVICRIPPSATPLLYIPFFSLPRFPPWRVFFGFPFAPLEQPPPGHHLPSRDVCIHNSQKVKQYNYCRCWNVDPIFLIWRSPLGYICNTFFLATRQLFPSSVYFSSTADLMVREYALMLKVSQHGCVRRTQMI